MSRISSDAQITFLLSCVKYSNLGKVDFTEVAKECDVVSRGAASKRYERLVRSHGVQANGGPVKKAEPRPKKRSPDAMAKAAEAKRRKIEGEGAVPATDDEDFQSVSPKIEFGGPTSVIKNEPGLHFDEFGFPIDLSFVVAHNPYNPRHIPTSTPIPREEYYSNQTSAPNVGQGFHSIQTMVGLHGSCPPYSPSLHQYGTPPQAPPGSSASTISDSSSTNIRGSPVSPAGPTSNMTISEKFIKSGPESAFSQPCTTVGQHKDDTSSISSDLDTAIEDFINSDLYMSPRTPHSTSSPAAQNPNYDAITSKTLVAQGLSSLNADQKASSTKSASHDISSRVADAPSTSESFNSGEETDFIVID